MTRVQMMRQGQNRYVYSPDVVGLCKLSVFAVTQIAEMYEKQALAQTTKGGKKRKGGEVEDDFW
jgi:hypothetical protein